MKTKLKKLWLGGCGLLMASAMALPAAEPATLSEWKLGEVQVGEAVTHEDLKGKVVVIDYWGVW